jgi:AhpD family alkylhydroperoxidase
MTTGTTLDARTRELIAIGASIGGNCLPCLRYHFAEARKLHCTLEEINEAIELAKTVKQRPIDDIYKLAADLVARERESEHNPQSQLQGS